MCVCSVAFTYALEHPSVSGDIKNIVVKKLGNFNIYQLMLFDTPQGKLNGFTWASGRGTVLCIPLYLHFRWVKWFYFWLVIEGTVLCPSLHLHFCWVIWF